MYDIAHNPRPNHRWTTREADRDAEQWPDLTLLIAACLGLAGMLGLLFLSAAAVWALGYALLAIW